MASVFLLRAPAKPWHAVLALMSDGDTSSANPEALQAFVTTAMQLDARLALGAVSLRAAIAEFTASCREYPTGIDESLADQLQDLARRNVEMNLWVGQVADQFAQADTGQVVSSVSETAGPGFADGLDAATLNALLAVDQSPASIAQALLDSLTPEQATQLLDLLGIANPGTGLVDTATQPTTLDLLAQARDDMLSFLGRVKDDPLGEVRRGEDALGQAKDSFFGEHPTEVGMLSGLLGMLAATPGAAPPVTCADGQIRLSQDAVDLLNGQKTLSSDISRQNLSLLAAEAAARCGQMESTQQVVETEAGGIALVSTRSPKDLWDTLSQMLNHDQEPPRGNRIVEPSADATVDGGGSPGGTSGIASAVAHSEPSSVEPIAPGAPGSIEHKAAAWVAYRAREGTQGWSYDRWSSVYDANMTRARTANAARTAYWSMIGYGQEEVQVTTPDGEIRILDIADKGAQIGIEYKTGYQSASVDNLSELRRDEALIRKGGWQIKWVFDGQASQPLKDALTAAGILYEGGGE